MNVLVTVGMGRWPFDRLIAAVDHLADEFAVFAQIGSARIEPACPHARFLAFDDLQRRIAEADVVITHAGNTVRLVQRAGKVPIAVARRASLGEMANDHQVDYLRREERDGRVIAVWELDRLAEVVREQPVAQATTLAQRPAPPPVANRRAAARLDALLCAPASPFARHPVRRYDYAFTWLAGRAGRHLDVGCGTGEFLETLASSSRLECVGVDAHAGYLRELAARAPQLETVRVPTDGSLPFADGSFDSVSLLDVLEHVEDEERALAEIHRVLAPGGLFVLSVPARHVFSCLDPDNAKYRVPGLHRAVYTRRFGAAAYHERFVDLSNGLRGDIAAGRREHTNYRREELEARLERAGFEIIQADGANLFWRWLHTPALLARGRMRRLLERGIALDGRLFSSANLFITAMRKESS